MAGDSTSLGKMVVDLLLKDDQFQSAMAGAQTSMQTGGANLQASATRAGAAITGAFKAASAAVAAFGAASAVVGANFEQQMAMVGALQGLEQTDKAFQDLQGQARLLGSTTEFTATQAAEALEALARAGATVDESITSSNSALTLAGTSAASLADSTELLVATQRQFGLEAAESERITNVFSLAMRKSLLDFSSVREAMKFAGTAGASFGMTLEQTTASVAAFRDLGLEGSLAGTNFRMAMIAAAKGTEQQDTALKKYGMTVADINPEQNTFIDIVEKMAEAGITASDAITVFGSRAGANIAQLAAETAKGNVNMREFTATLMTASAEGNTAADMYNTIGQTVAFASKVAVSALQDLMIEVFDTFAGPLRGLIETLPVVLNAVTEALRSQAPAIKASFADALGGISKFLKENAAGLGDAFVNLIKLVASLGPVLIHISELLIVVARNADFLLAALGFGAAVVAAIKLVSVVTALSVALGSTSSAVVVLGTTLTVTTGGLFAAVLAVGALVTGLGVLITNLVGARNETARLQKAQEEQAKEQDASAKALEAELAPMLRRQQAMATQRLRTEELTDAETQRLQRLVQMTTAEAAQLELQGKLIRTGGELREVGELVNKMGADAITFLDGEAAGMDATVKAADKKIAALGKLHASAEVATQDATRSEDLRKASEILGQGEIATVEELAVRLQALGVTRETTAARAQALRNQVALNAQEKIKDEVSAEFDAKREIAMATTAGAEDKTDKVAESNAKIVALRRKLMGDLVKLHGDETGEIQMGLDDRLARIKKAFDERVQAADGNAADITVINQRRESAISAANEIARLEQKDADKEAAADRVAIEQRVADQVTRIVASDAGAVQRLEAEKQATLTKLAENGASDRQLAAAAGALDKRIGQAQISEQRRVQDIMLGLQGKHLSKKEQRARAEADLLESLSGESTEVQAAALKELGKTYKFDLGDAIKDAAKAIAGFGAAAVGAAKQAAGAISGILSDVAGFSFNLQDAVQGAMDLETDALDAQASAQEDIAAAQERLTAATEGGDPEDVASAQAGLAEAQSALSEAEASLAGGMPGFAQQFVTTLIDNAVNFATALGENAGVILNALADQLPILLDAVIMAIPQVVSAIVENVPLIVQSVVDALPALLTALVEGATEVLLMIMDMLPGLITDLLTVVLPSLIKDLSEAIPKILQGVVDALPKILNAIIEAIPIVLGAIIEALPVLIESVVSAIPQILTSLLQAIPQIVSAVLGMIPMLITTIIGAIPDILMGFIDNLPDLLAAVISLIPVVVLEIVAAMPAIAMALVEAVIFELLPKLPMIVVELFKAVVAGMGKAMKDIAEGIWNAIKGFFNIFKKKDGKGSNNSAFSGIDYVPATMRMTVHKGEAVVDAARNAQSSSASAPAPAGAAQNGMGGGGGGGGAPIDIAIIAEGRLLDAVQVQAMKRGGAVGIQNEIRRSSGVRVGLDRGRFNPWSK